MAEPDVILPLKRWTTLLFYLAVAVASTRQSKFYFLQLSFYSIIFGYPQVFTLKSESMAIDNIDVKILKTLQSQGRITNIELSQKVGLSAAPTLERVKKLEKAGIINSYHAKVDPHKIGLGFSALINVSLERQKDNAMTRFREKIEAIEEVVECLQVTGNFDYQLRVMVKDIPKFEQLIAGKLSKIEEIGQMQTMVVLNEVKSSRSLPIEAQK
jgi:Lrp/AsnC family leucine-responsive transcriptional regulator